MMQTSWRLGIEFHSELSTVRTDRVLAPSIIYIHPCLAANAVQQQGFATEESREQVLSIGKRFEVSCEALRLLSPRRLVDNLY